MSYLLKIKPRHSLRFLNAQLRILWPQLKQNIEMVWWPDGNALWTGQPHSPNQTPPPPNKSFLSPSKYKRICLNDSEVLFLCFNLTNVICSDIKYRLLLEATEWRYVFICYGNCKALKNMLNNLYCKKQTSANSEISTKIIFIALGFLVILILRIYTKKTTRIKGCLRTEVNIWT